MSILWLIVALLVVLWLIGVLGSIGGSMIHILLVLALVVLLYNLLVGRPAA